MKRLFFICFLICFFQQVYSQSTDEQLAYQYYQNKQYDKAIVYYEKVFPKKPTPDNYHYYLDCLLQTKDYKTAEKVIKKEMKQEPDNSILFVDLGMLYKIEGDDKQTKDAFTKAIHKLPADRDKILNLGTAFVDEKEYDYALETYNQGKTLLGDSYPFVTEIGAVYKAQGNTTAMVDSYLETLSLSPTYIQYVQDALQLSVGNYADEGQNTIVKTELLKYIQRYPDKDVFSELLIWMLLQLRDYPNALVQVKALDRRKNEGGWRVMNFATTCVTAGAYDPAIQAYQYVIDRGPKGDNYTRAKMEQLSVMYDKLVNGGGYTKEELIVLENKYNQALTELTKTSGSVSLMQQLAQLEGFYLHNDSIAIGLMHEAVDMPGISIQTQARCRMELADLLLADGETWEASLLYSKVEQAFKEEPIGDEAKFKNATIYYYTGNFKWALAQLNILRSATTKLIANDAMALSLVVSDNTQDSAMQPALLLFAHVQLLDFQNYEDSVALLLDSVYNISGTTTLKEEVLLMRASLAEKKGDYEKALGFYSDEQKVYPDGMLPDKALYLSAKLEDTKLHDQKKAAELYKQLILKYPGSFYIEETRDRYRQLVKDDAPPVN
ncbi:MAG TPA: CDC27 family protein [Bacteroidia bacterium]|nr:CDC27 family protein [Bacteroidia bacterium]